MPLDLNSNNIKTYKLGRTFCVCFQLPISKMKVKLDRLPPLPKRQQACAVLMSLIPYISFLITYGANVYVRILPVTDDSSSVRLYNVSQWGSLVIPFSVHKWISSRHYTLLDFLSAVPYLAHYCIPVLFPIFLYLTDRLDSVSRFYRLLGLSCWTQYVIWYLLPTYPPWSYSTEPTSTPVQTTLKIAASVVQVPEVAKSMLLDHMEGQAFSRLDQVMNIKFFHSMFAGNPVPFAAFPSGHVAWSMCMLLVLPNESRRVMFVYVCWVTWAVLYSGHHYLFDAIGAILAVEFVHRLTIWIYPIVENQNPLPVVYFRKPPLQNI